MNTISQLIDNPLFTLVSIREKSVPDAGSRCVTVGTLRRNTPVTREILHRTGDVTLVTPYGFLRFWKDIKE